MICKCLHKLNHVPRKWKGQNQNEKSQEEKIREKEKNMSREKDVRKNVYFIGCFGFRCFDMIVSEFSILLFGWIENEKIKYYFCVK